MPNIQIPYQINYKTRSAIYLFDPWWHITARRTSRSTASNRNGCSRSESAGYRLTLPNSPLKGIGVRGFYKDVYRKVYHI